MPKGIYPITGYAAFKRNATKTKVFFRDTAASSAERAADELLEKMKENASLTDHTLADLRRMGHPYAKRQPAPPHDPYWLVHKQSGDLYDAIEKTPVQSNPGKNKFFVEVGADEAKARHARWVIMGTPKMISRDFVTGTYKQERENLMKMIEENMAQRMYRKIRDFLRI